MSWSGHQREGASVCLSVVSHALFKLLDTASPTWLCTTFVYYINFVYYIVHVLSWSTETWMFLFTLLLIAIKLFTYRSLVKEHPWVELLNVCQMGWGGGLFWVFLHLTTNKRPCHVSSDSIPLKQIYGQNYRIAGNFHEHKFSRITNKYARKQILRFLFLQQGHDIWPHPLHRNGDPQCVFQSQNNSKMLARSSKRVGRCQRRTTMPKGGS